MSNVFDGASVKLSRETVMAAIEHYLNHGLREPVTIQTIKIVEHRILAGVSDEFSVSVNLAADETARALPDDDAVLGQRKIAVQ